MIAPILPEAENLTSMLTDKVDYMILDRMNYYHAAKIYEKHGWKEKNTYEYFKYIGSKIVNICNRLGI